MSGGYGALSAVRLDYRVSQIHKALSGGRALGHLISHQMRDKPPYSWTGKTTSHHMLVLREAARW